ncbi:MAG TPA: MaoC family dehydratase [Chloroflexota bacterium]|nr:MaoC family dehydratase [Chloroflexota bacterium]
MATELPAEVQTVEELKGLVGQELGVGGWTEITQELVNAFADLTGDHQYIHVDPERARETMFGGTIAHGYLTLSLLPRLARERQGVRLNLGGRMSVNYGLNRLRFPGAVPVGKRIRLRTRLLEVQELNPGAGPDGRPRAVQLTFQQTVEVEGAERPGMVAETISRIYF